MFTLLISVIVSAAAVTACKLSAVGSGEMIAAGVAAFLVSYFLVGWIVRKKVSKVQNELQELLMSAQKKANWKIQQFQSKPGGNIKQLQRQIENDQKAVVAEALAFTRRFEPFRKWSLLMGRQLATMRFQFFYQLKEFKEADEILAGSGLFNGPLMMEPMMVAMKMARQYKNGDLAGVEKTFKRRIRWFRGNRGALLYGVMSWIYVKEGESDKARLLLDKAKKITANETLAHNWEMLANCKEKHFSNAGLGEEWYALYLENPPLPKQKRMRGNARGGRMQ
jgi:hypothetical protein